MDIYDPQTLGIVVFGGFMVISAIGIALVSTFSMKETSYEEALAKQRQELAKAQPQQRTEKKKKDKAAEKKNREKKKKEEKPKESETIPDANKETIEDQDVSLESQGQKPEPVHAPKSAAAPVDKTAPAISIKSTEPSESNTAPSSASETSPTPASKASSATAAKTSSTSPSKTSQTPAAKSAPVLAPTTPVQPAVSAPTCLAPTEVPSAISPKDKKKKEKKVVKVEPAPTQAPPVVMLETVVKEVSVMAVPPVESQKSVPVVEALAKAEKPKASAPSKKKAGSKKSTEFVAVDAVDAPLHLPYETLLSTLKSMVFSEGEAQQLSEILSEKTGLQDTWHTATQKGDPVTVLKKQLEEKERQVSAAQEDSIAAKNRLRELSKELSAEKSKVASVETRLSSQLSKREQEMIALQARMQASYQDHLAETQQLNAKVAALQEQLEKGPNAQLARLQQENSILRDALNKATSQTDSKQNAELAKVRQDCARLNKELGEKLEALRSEEQLRKSLETKASVAEKQLCQLQTCRVSSEQALQRRLEEVSEELRKAQGSNSSLQTQLGQAQQDSVALTEVRGRMAALEAELREQVGQVEGLQAQLSQAELENRQLQEQLGSVHTLLEASQSKEQEHNTEVLVSELEEAKISLKQKESRVSLLEEELTQLRDTVSRLEGAATETESPSNNENQNQVESLQEELRSLSEELERLKTAENRAAELEHLQKSLREREAQLYSLEEELKQHKEHNTNQVNTSTQLESLQNSLSEKERLVTDLQEKLQCLAEEAHQAKDKSDHSTEDLQAFQTETISALQSLFPHININTKQDKWLQEFSEKAQETISAREQCLESQQSKVTELLGRLSEVRESQSTLQADCEQYRSVLAETEGMLKTLQRSVEEEETGWRTRVTELEEQLRRALQKVQMLEEATENLRAENKNAEQLKEHVVILEDQLEKQNQSDSSNNLSHSEEMKQLKQLLSESEHQLQAAQKEALSHREELAQNGATWSNSLLFQVRQQLSQMKDHAEKWVENGQSEPQACQVQAEMEQTVEMLQAEQALKQQLSEQAEQAHRAVAELQIQLDLLRAAGENPSDTEDVAELKERLEKERKLTKDLGQAATKLQQLLRSSQDQLTKEKETVRILQEKLQEKEEGTELKEGTSV
ncbi:ribosome-binding protein 1a isoform X2 [Pygocentrus nattereri]|uniref:ribosome-binding protein 1a isoform X2 n=1 Tax=Pygocentrus nattereri TaxID=42514 RepID=UPI0018917E02|nr:ribosome-binding protein 1a isoform X2 [Pygocentrus nattereri]